MVTELLALWGAGLSAPLGIVDGRDHKSVGDWLFTGRVSGDAACRSLRLALGLLPESPEDMASPHRCRGRSLPPGVPAQPGGDRGPQDLSQQAKGGRGIDTARPTGRCSCAPATSSLTPLPTARRRSSPGGDATGTLPAEWRVEE